MAARHIGWVRSLFASPAHRRAQPFAPRPARRRDGRLTLFALPALVGLAGLLMPPASLSPAYGQANEAPPEIEKSNYRVQGEVMDGGYLRSGPNDNFYFVQHLNPGAVITVVGKKGKWLVVEPPEGCYSLVSKQYVHKYGDGTKGRVEKQDQIVRAASDIQPQSQTAVQTRLSVGQDVTIVGDENEYFKIKPPEGAYLFIEANKVRPLPKKAEPGAPGVPAASGVGPGNGTRGADPGNTAGPGPGTAPPSPAGPDRSASRPTGTPRDVATEAGHAAPGGTAPGTGAAPAEPTTRPVVSESLARLQKLESEFTAASSQPLPEQPIEALLAGYESLASAPGVPEPTRKMADARARTLKVRAQVRDEFVAVQQRMPEERKKIEAGLAEQEELQASIKKLDVHVYIAVGTLRPSSLQVGNGGGHTTLYRLTDPATGRGLIYIRTSDPKYADLIGQFVGVKGRIGTESQLNLKVIAPTLVEAVDPSKVNNNVAAEIIPPSLLPRTPAAPTTPTASSGQ